MSRLKRLINEIHWRCLWQVLSVYLTSSWIVFQVADTVTDAPNAYALLISSASSDSEVGRRITE